MQGIINIFTEIGNFIGSAVNFIVSFFEDIVYIIGLIGAAIAKIPSLFSWLPSSVLVLLGVALTVIIVYKVMGRD